MQTLMSSHVSALRVSHLLTGFLLLVLATSSAWANIFGNSPEPLSVEEAFQVTVVATTPNRLELRIAIAEGYYLYRDKLSMTLDDDPQVATLQLPPAQIIDDQFFGEMATYRGQLVAGTDIVHPVAGALKVAVNYQGCADIGLCYPPTTAFFQITLPAAAPASNSSNGNTTTSQSGQKDATPNALQPLQGTSNSTISDLLNAPAFGDDEPEILPPEVAFVPLVSILDNNRIEVDWQIEPGHYLYQNKLGFSLSRQGALAAQLPEGTLQQDEYFGDVMIYRGNAKVLLTPNTAVSGNDDLLVNYQGCADIGICYPPQSLTIPVTFAAGANVIAAISDTSNNGGGAASGANPSSTDTVAAATTAAQQLFMY